MPRRKDPAGPRAAMIDSAISLIRRRGVAAVAFADVLAESGAPRGSVYHHFPRGRTQLVTEATEAAGQRVTAEMRRALAADDIGDALRAVADLLQRGLDRGDYAVGCPIAAAALSTEPDAAAAAGATFAAWRTMLIERFTAAGVPAGRAAGLAVLVISAFEGAIIVARAERNPAALDAVVDELTVLCRATADEK